jgi:hypothetical protein
VTRASKARVALLVVPPGATGEAAGIAMAMAADAANSAGPADILAAAGIGADDQRADDLMGAPAGTKKVS